MYDQRPPLRFRRLTWLAFLLLLWPVLPSQAGERARVVFSRLGPSRIGLFLADRDGKNERPLLPASGLDYNASFSGDGQSILFTSERGGSADVYRVRLDGSGLEQLTDSPSYDDQAALSPDGRTLAFVSTRDGGTANVWLLDLRTHHYSNLTRNTAGNFRPSWSPDGQWIAFSSDRDTKPGRITPSWELLQSTALYLIHPDGSGLRRLTDLGGYDGSPQWSGDGKSLIFYRSSPRDAFRRAASQISSIDPDTKEVRTLTTGPDCKASPRWVSGGEIAYVVLEGTNEGVRFTSGQMGISGAPRCPAWSADGKMMVYQKTLESESRLTPAFSLEPKFELLSSLNWMPAYSPTGDRLALTDRHGGLLMMKGDGSDLHTVYETTNGRVAFPRWSPDGSQIFFGFGAFFARPVRPSQLALIRPDGSGFKMLTEGKASSGFANWSPDGKQLVYRVMGNGELGLRILTIDSGKITQLTSEYDTFPFWSPRGDRIAFCSSRDGDFDIYTIRPDGADIRKLTDSHGNDAHPLWSPDGNWIVFSSSRKGHKDERMLNNAGPQPYGELFIMRADGSEVTQLTDNQWEDATPAWRPEPLTRSKLSAHQP